MKRLAKSMHHGFRGIATTFRSEPNFRIHCVLSVAAVVFGIALHISLGEWVAVVFAIGFVMAAEALNTAIEKLADRVEPEIDPAIGVAKDASAAGVLITAIAAGVVGAIIFLPKLWNWLNLLLEARN
ncbi:MAG: diacylglycerol kinase [Verrucomicrobiales bacterium]